MKQFIAEHINDDVNTLALQAKRYPEIDMEFALRQISGRQKIKQKLPSFYANPEIVFPVLLSVEQSSSEYTAQYKASLVSGERFTDLTGGFGIDCLYFSKNFGTAVYNERNTELYHLVKLNYAVLEAKNIVCFNKNADDLLFELSGQDVIYIDPARRDHSGNKVVSIADCEPDISILKNSLFEKAPVVLVKLSPMLDISLAIHDLPETAEVHVVSVDNDCKEVLLVLKKEFAEDVLIKTVNIDKSGKYHTFSFTRKNETETEIVFTSIPSGYLYEPDSSVMKAGAFKSIALHFELQKLHINTHLYASEKLIENFPGRVFNIEEICGSNKSDLKYLKSHYPKANITARNFPSSVAQLRQKSGIKEGGDTYLFACKLCDNRNVIIRCSKIV
ncbi:MAG: SAM-dependent methyltransferase [Paludibacter sp.]|nr:SAM-dependent methyltransferase [Paludibacter sp.]